MNVDAAALGLLGFVLAVIVAAKVAVEIAAARALVALGDRVDPSGRLAREFLEEQARLLGVFRDSTTLSASLIEAIRSMRSLDGFRAHHPRDHHLAGVGARRDRSPVAGGGAEAGCGREVMLAFLEVNDSKPIRPAILRYSEELLGAGHASGVFFCIDDQQVLFLLSCISDDRDASSGVKRSGFAKPENFHTDPSAAVLVVDFASNADLDRFVRVVKTFDCVFANCPDREMT